MQVDDGGFRYRPRCTRDSSWSQVVAGREPEIDNMGTTFTDFLDERAFSSPECNSDIQPLTYLLACQITDEARNAAKVAVPKNVRDGPGAARIQVR
jgi:hypothetical protein